MVRFHATSTLVLLALLSVQLVLSVDPSETSPAPAPQIGAEFIPEPPDAGAPVSPSPLPEMSSPPSDLPPGSSPTPLPAASRKSPAPTPSQPSHVSTVKSDMTADSDDSKESSGGHKAGIVLGVIAGACLVGFGGMVYRKRQQNIRRAHYGYAARREIL